MTVQIRRQEITRPFLLQLPDHVILGDGDMVGRNAWNLGYFLGFLFKDRGKVRGRDGFAGILTSMRIG